MYKIFILTFTIIFAILICSCDTTNGNEPNGSEVPIDTTSIDTVKVIVDTPFAPEETEFSEVEEVTTKRR